MAQVRYTRIDNNRRQSSNYFSTISVVVLVAICLVAVWMLTSSSSGAPGQNVDIPSQEQRNEMNDQVTESTPGRNVDLLPQEQRNGMNDQVTEGTPGRNVDLLPQEQRNGMNDQVTESTDNNSKQFNDNPGNLPDDAMQGEVNGNADSGEDNSNMQENRDTNPDEKPDANPEEKPEEKYEDKPEEKSQEISNDESNSETNNGETNAQEGDSKALDGEKNQEEEGTKPNEVGGNESGLGNSEDSSMENKSDSRETDKKSDSSDIENKPDRDESQTNLNSDQPKQEMEQVGQTEEKGNAELEQSINGQANNQSSGDVLPSVPQTELLNQTIAQTGSFSTQAVESKGEKETQKFSEQQSGFIWKACNVTAGPDYIPCLDNVKAIKSLRSTKHYEHRERHCPEEPPTCLVPLPDGYRQSIGWPKSREKIWYYNVPHTKLAQYKGHQNWVKVTGEFLTFPGGGTQFKFGALHYIDFINESIPDIAWGKHSRVVLDVGCGVASFGGYLFDRDVLTMSLAPKDEHEAQVQFALERGIPAISAVMGTKRLPYPSMVFDVIHCARCRVPWHIEGGKLLLELNRVLRPGGYFVWSATPVYQKQAEDVAIWQAMTQLTKDVCWDLVSITKDRVDKVGIATYRKPTTNECYEKRSKQEPPMCEESDDANAAWNVPLQACMHKVPVDSQERGVQWPEEWPMRLEKTPYWLQSSQVGVYGKPAPDDFKADYEHWKRVVSNSYRNRMGINWSRVRNVMDMNAVYGGFAAALNDTSVWVMNVVSVDSADTLPILYERGLFGIYHDWCESFSTYPRSYDLLHADHLFSKIKKRCDLLPVVTEVDRILRPGGKMIVRDNAEILTVLEAYVRAMQWEVTVTYSKNNEGLLCVQKSMWRPKESITVEYAIE